MFKSKIHRATLTDKALNDEGSIALDQRLMNAADLMPGEQVHVLNVNTGDRLVAYVIESPAGSGTVMLNGPPTLRISHGAWGHNDSTAIDEISVFKGTLIRERLRDDDRFKGRPGHAAQMVA